MHGETMKICSYMCTHIQYRRSEFRSIKSLCPKDTRHSDLMSLVRKLLQKCVHRCSHTQSTQQHFNKL